MADLQDDDSLIRYCDKCGRSYPIGHRHWDYVGLSPFGCPIFENDSPLSFQPTEPSEADYVQICTCPDRFDWILLDRYFSGEKRYDFIEANAGRVRSCPIHGAKAKSTTTSTSLVDDDKEEKDG